MMSLLDATLVDWSRAQFAMTAMYHWLFVPLTLGLGVIMSVMETLYVRTGNEEWKKAAQFWMTLFGINFAIGVATGIILEFEFGTNWSNYSWFVGDIFGAPLAIEAILAFFMEATFISIMFFGWKKVSKRFHLAATWLTVLGATISALWILVANAWMQYPVGMEFNPNTVRNEMVDFWSILLSPVALNKFFHTVLSGWVLSGLFVTGVSAWYLLKKRQLNFALKSMKVAAVFGLISTLLIAYTGDGSAYNVSQRQPMKLAAMEGLYQGKTNAGLVAIGVLNPAKKAYNDATDPFLFKIQIPSMLSLLSQRDINAFVPGISNILDGGYQTKQGVALSFLEKQARGRAAIQSLALYQKAVTAKDTTGERMYKAQLKENYPQFGYGYIDKAETMIPSVPTVFYSFHLMVILGFYFIVLFALVLYFVNRKQIQKTNWLLWICLLSIPLGYVAGELGWVVAEVGRQPWAIQDVLPLNAAISNISSDSVRITFFLFLFLFSALLLAEVRIMLKQIKKGPEGEK
ncbi:MAG: cytochrome ubiquinol oxidase subunit I [Bacteroidota bacterium]|nr:cytochrome ubiquinol oxidase subunit I [Bacteroidota bacterium]